MSALKTLLHALKLRFCQPPDHTWFANADARQAYASLVHMTPNNALRKSRAFPPLSNGACAYVTKLHNGLVLKINHKPDPAYGDFLRLAIARQDNPFYPKILAAGFHGNHHIVVMEELMPLDINTSPFLVRALQRFAVRNFLDKPIPLRKILRTPEGCLARQLQKKPLFQMMRDIASFRHTRRLDINHHNVMLRANGQVVITDPLCGSIF